jgi:hypothetical protein
MAIVSEEKCNNILYHFFPLSAVSFLGSVASKENLVTVARLRRNRVLYRLPDSTDTKRGHPRWYGSRFALKEKSTWTKPDEIVQNDGINIAIISEKRK